MKRASIPDYKKLKSKWKKRRINKSKANNTWCRKICLDLIAS